MKRHHVWKWTATLLLACSIVLSGCSSNKGNNSEVVPTETPASENGSGNAVAPEDSNNSEAGQNGNAENTPDTDAGADNSATEKAKGLQGIVQQINENVEMPPMTELDGDAIKDTFYLEADQYAEGVFLIAMMNIKATDMAIIKLNDADDFDTIKEALTKRAEDVIKTFSTYLPDQHEDAKNYQIVQEGEYVLYSISHDQEKVLETFKAALK